jgi:hypothetical protein
VSGQFAQGTLHSMTIAFAYGGSQLVQRLPFPVVRKFATQFNA